MTKEEMKDVGLRSAKIIQDTSDALHRMLNMVPFSIAYQKHLGALTDAKLELERIADELKTIFEET